jgi:hypothetical protein
MREQEHSSGYAGILPIAAPNFTRLMNTGAFSQSRTSITAD